jgi:uncharacterized membrane protein
VPIYNGDVQRALAIILTAGALAWSAALLLAPYALTSGSPRLIAIAGPIYGAAGLICHQRSERSFHLAGVQLPVCGRCSGLYFSGAAGALLAWLMARQPRTPRRTRAALIAAAIPTALSVLLEFSGLLYSSNMLRAVTALPLGACAGWILFQARRADAAAARGGAPAGMRYDARGL